LLENFLKIIITIIIAMAIVKLRKPFKVGRGQPVISFPRGWTTLEGEVIIALDRVGLVIPRGLEINEIKRDVEKLLEVLEKKVNLNE